MIVQGVDENPLKQMEVDWSVFERHIEKAIELVPIFQTAGIKTTVCGAEAFTPDHKPLIGKISIYYCCSLGSGLIGCPRGPIFDDPRVIVR